MDFLEVTMFQADLEVKEIQLASDSQILKLKVCASIYDSFLFSFGPWLPYSDWSIALNFSDMG